MRRLLPVTRGDLLMAAHAYDGALARWDEATEDLGTRIAYDRMDRDPQVRRIKQDHDASLRDYNTLVRRYLEQEHTEEINERRYQAEVRRLAEEARAEEEKAQEKPLKQNARKAAKAGES